MMYLHVIQVSTNTANQQASSMTGGKAEACKGGGVQW